MNVFSAGAVLSALLSYLFRPSGESHCFKNKLPSDLFLLRFPPAQLSISCKSITFLFLHRPHQHFFLTTEAFVFHRGYSYLLLRSCDLTPVYLALQVERALVRGSANEVRAWHGTRLDNIGSIITSGFTLNPWTRNGNLYGKPSGGGGWVEVPSISCCCRL